MSSIIFVPCDIKSVKFSYNNTQFTFSKGNDFKQFLEENTEEIEEFTFILSVPTIREEVVHSELSYDYGKHFVNLPYVETTCIHDKDEKTVTPILRDQKPVSDDIYYASVATSLLLLSCIISMIDKKDQYGIVIREEVIKSSHGKSVILGLIFLMFSIASFSNWDKENLMFEMSTNIECSYKTEIIENIETLDSSLNIISLDNNTYYDVFKPDIVDKRNYDENTYKNIDTNEIKSFLEGIKDKNKCIQYNGLIFIGVDHSSTTMVSSVVLLCFITFFVLILPLLIICITPTFVFIKAKYKTYITRRAERREERRAANMILEEDVVVSTVDDDITKDVESAPPSYSRNW